MGLLARLESKAPEASKGFRAPKAREVLKVSKGFRATLAKTELKAQQASGEFKAL